MRTELINGTSGNTPSVRRFKTVTNDLLSTETISKRLQTTVCQQKPFQNGS